MASVGTVELDVQLNLDSIKPEAIEKRLAKDFCIPLKFCDDSIARSQQQLKASFKDFCIPVSVCKDSLSRINQQISNLISEPKLSVETKQSIKVNHSYSEAQTKQTDKVVSAIEKSSKKTGIGVLGVVIASVISRSITQTGGSVISAFLKGIETSLSSAIGSFETIPMVFGQEIGKYLDTELRSLNLKQAVEGDEKTSDNIIPLLQSIHETLGQELGRAVVVKQADAEQTRQREDQKLREYLSPEIEKTTGKFSNEAADKALEEVKKMFKQLAIASKAVTERSKAVAKDLGLDKLQDKAEQIESQIKIYGTELKRLNDIKNKVSDPQELKKIEAESNILIQNIDSLSKNLEPIVQEATSLNQSVKNVINEQISDLEALGRLVSVEMSKRADIFKAREVGASVGVVRSSQQELVDSSRAFASELLRKIAEFYEFNVPDFSQIPKVRVRESMNAVASYSGKTNTINVSKEMAGRIADSSISQKDYEVISHELIHAFQNQFGEIPGDLARLISATPLMDISDIPEEMRESILKEAELSTQGALINVKARGGSLTKAETDVLRKQEVDAYTRGRVFAKNTFSPDSVKKEQQIRAVGAEGAIAETLQIKVKAIYESLSKEIDNPEIFQLLQKKVVPLFEHIAKLQKLIQEKGDSLNFSVAATLIESTREKILRIYEEFDKIKGVNPREATEAEVEAKAIVENIISSITEQEKSAKALKAVKDKFNKQAKAATEQEKIALDIKNTEPIVSKFAQQFLMSIASSFDLDPSTVKFPQLRVAKKELAEYMDAIGGTAFQIPDSNALVFSPDFAQKLSGQIDLAEEDIFELFEQFTALPHEFRHAMQFGFGTLTHEQANRGEFGVELMRPDADTADLIQRMAESSASLYEQSGGGVITPEANLAMEVDAYTAQFKAVAEFFKKIGLTDLDPEELTKQYFEKIRSIGGGSLASGSRPEAREQMNAAQEKINAAKTQSEKIEGEREYMQASTAISEYLDIDALPQLQEIVNLVKSIEGGFNQGISASSVKVGVPGEFLQQQMKQSGVMASYRPFENALVYSTETIEKLKDTASSASLTLDEFRDVIHELRHSVQYGFGDISPEELAEGRVNVDLIEPTAEEYKSIQKGVEGSVSAAKPKNSNLTPEALQKQRIAAIKIEKDAYTFALRNEEKLYKAYLKRIELLKENIVQIPIPELKVAEKEMVEIEAWDTQALIKEAESISRTSSFHEIKDVDDDLAALKASMQGMQSATANMTSSLQATTEELSNASQGFDELSLAAEDFATNFVSRTAEELQQITNIIEKVFKKADIKKFLEQSGLSSIEALVNRSEQFAVADLYAAVGDEGVKSSYKYKTPELLNPVASEEEVQNLKQYYKDYRKAISNDLKLFKEVLSLGEKGINIDEVIQAYDNLYTKITDLVNYAEDFKASNLIPLNEGQSYSGVLTSIKSLEAALEGLSETIYRLQPEDAQALEAVQASIDSLIDRPIVQFQAKGPLQNTSNAAVEDSRSVSEISEEVVKILSALGASEDKIQDVVLSLAQFNSRLDNVAEAENIAREKQNESEFALNQSLAGLEKGESIFGRIGRIIKGNINLTGEFGQNLLKLGSIFAGSFVTGFLKDKLQELAGAAIEVYTRFEVLDKTLEFLAGSPQKAAQQFEYLRGEINRTSADLEISLREYNKLAASTRGTTLEGVATDELFSGVLQAGTAFGLTGDELSGSLLAISQIAGKGTVSMEELRGQLAERIPGAFQIAARAMGVTEQELGKIIASGDLAATDFLPKFARQLSRETADGVTGASETARASINRLQNTVTELQIAFGKEVAPTYTKGLNIFNTILGLLLNNIPQITKVVLVLSVALSVRFVKALIGIFTNSIKAKTGLSLLQQGAIKLGQGLKIASVAMKGFLLSTGIAFALVEGIAALTKLYQVFIAEVEQDKISKILNQSLLEGERQSYKLKEELVELKGEINKLDPPKVPKSNLDAQLQEYKQLRTAAFNTGNVLTIIGTDIQSIFSGASAALKDVTEGRNLEKLKIDTKNGALAQVTTRAESVIGNSEALINKGQQLSDRIGILTTQAAQASGQERFNILEKIKVAQKELQAVTLEPDTLLKTVTIAIDSLENQLKEAGNKEFKLALESEIEKLNNFKEGLEKITQEIGPSTPLSQFSKTLREIQTSFATATREAEDFQSKGLTQISANLRKTSLRDYFAEATAELNRTAIELDVTQQRLSASQTQAEGLKKSLFGATGEIGELVNQFQGLSLEQLQTELDVTDDKDEARKRTLSALIQLRESEREVLSQQQQEQEILLKQEQQRSQLAQERLQRELETLRAEAEIAQSNARIPIVQLQIEGDTRATEIAEKEAAIQIEAVSRTESIRQKELAGLNRLKQQGLITARQYEDQMRQLKVQGAQNRLSILEAELQAENAKREAAQAERNRTIEKLRAEAEIAQSNARLPIIQQQIQGGVGQPEIARQEAALALSTANRTESIRQKELQSLTRLKQQGLITSEQYEEQLRQLKVQGAQNRVQITEAELQTENAKREAATARIQRQLEQTQKQFELQSVSIGFEVEKTGQQSQQLQLEQTVADNLNNTAIERLSYQKQLAEKSKDLNQVEALNNEIYQSQLNKIAAENELKRQSLELSYQQNTLQLAQEESQARLSVIQAQSQVQQLEETKATAAEIALAHSDLEIKQQSLKFISEKAGFLEANKQLELKSLDITKNTAITAAKQTRHLENIADVENKINQSLENRKSQSELITASIEQQTQRLQQSAAISALLSDEKLAALNHELQLAQNAQNLTAVEALKTTIYRQQSQQLIAGLEVKKQELELTTQQQRLTAETAILEAQANVERLKASNATREQLIIAQSQLQNAKAKTGLIEDQFQSTLRTYELELRNNQANLDRQKILETQQNAIAEINQVLEVQRRTVEITTAKTQLQTEALQQQSQLQNALNAVISSGQQNKQAELQHQLRLAETAKDLQGIESAKTRIYQQQQVELKTQMAAQQSQLDLTQEQQQLELESKRLNADIAISEAEAYLQQLKINNATEKQLRIARDMIALRQSQKDAIESQSATLDKIQSAEQERLRVEQIGKESAIERNRQLELQQQKTAEIQANMERINLAAQAQGLALDNVSKSLGNQSNLLQAQQGLQQALATEEQAEISLDIKKAEFKGDTDKVEKLKLKAYEVQIDALLEAQEMERELLRIKEEQAKIDLIRARQQQLVNIAQAEAFMIQRSVEGARPAEIAKLQQIVDLHRDGLAVLQEQAGMQSKINQIERDRLKSQQRTARLNLQGEAYSSNGSSPDQKDSKPSFADIRSGRAAEERQKELASRQLDMTDHDFYDVFNAREQQWRKDVQLGDDLSNSSVSVSDFAEKKQHIADILPKSNHQLSNSLLHNSDRLDNLTSAMTGFIQTIQQSGIKGGIENLTVVSNNPNQDAADIYNNLANIQYL